MLEAESGDRDVEMAKSYAGPIHLLFTDMVMPGMNGRSTAKCIRALHPETRVVFMTGFTGMDSKEFETNEIVLQKPFARSVLPGKVRDGLTGLR